MLLNWKLWQIKRWFSVKPYEYLLIKKIRPWNKSLFTCLLKMWDVKTGAPRRNCGWTYVLYIDQMKWKMYPYLKSCNVPEHIWTPVCLSSMIALWCTQAWFSWPAWKRCAQARFSRTWAWFTSVWSLTLPNTRQLCLVWMCPKAGNSL